jgi:hypothetical protein
LPHSYTLGPYRWLALSRMVVGFDVNIGERQWLQVP